MTRKMILVAVLSQIIAVVALILVLLMREKIDRIALEFYPGEWRTICSTQTLQDEGQRAYGGMYVTKDEDCENFTKIKVWVKQ